MEVEDGSDDTSSDDCIRKTVGYRKERMEKNEKFNGILDWIRNPILYSV